MEEIFDKIHEQIKPYAVYFPQFHETTENNINYYPGFTDIKNLNFYINDTNNSLKLDVPMLDIYGLNEITDYVLTNIELQKKQVNLAKKYGISGFAIYYYWFSTNTYTNCNTIMEKGYNNFFTFNVEKFNIFFIWPNEDWGGSIAINGKISNEYTEENFLKNAQNLLRYFQHDNYLKINNKPVFFIMHSWLIPNYNLLVTTFNNYLIENGFSGIYIVGFSFLGIENYDRYETHPVYKKINNECVFNENENEKIIDYSKYRELAVKNDKNVIETVFFSFDNTARMYLPKKSLVTKTINNTPNEQKLFIEKVFKKYLINDNTNLKKIVLINSWNEWGENMSIEPSINKKFFYLDLIKTTLIKIFGNFNWKHYLIANNDLINANIINENNACIHWEKYGINENRIFNRDNVKKKTILHVLHNCGGGTEVYVNNMIKSLPNYEHFKFKIVNDDFIDIATDFFDLVIVHHLLFIKNGIPSIAKNTGYSLLNLNCKKIFIVHDYVLILPKTFFYSKNSKPSNENIEYTKEYLSKFDKVFFNSKNCYDNYCKFVKLENFCFTNTVPDIHIYNPRIFLKNKEKHRVAILGHINAVDKGLNVANHIFEKSLTHSQNYCFYVFGNYEKQFTNVKCLGSYKNEDIFKLLKANDIDMFLFISIVEETYSYTASIALNTGLPIIFNNIGVYKDRFIYENCFPFEVENIKDEFPKIFNNVKRGLYEKPECKFEISNHLTGFKSFLKSENQFNVDFEYIKKNLCYNKHIFINANTSEYLNKIYQQIKQTDEYFLIDFIFVTILSNENFYLPQDYKILLLNNSKLYEDSLIIDLFYSNLNFYEISYYKQNSLFENKCSKIIKKCFI